MRYHPILASCLALACLAWSGQGLPQAARGKPDAPAAKLLNGDPVAGRHKSDDERCQECHGHDGNANDIEDGVGNIGKFPRLAGQLPEYLQKQLHDFRRGTRQNDTMLVMARSVSDADMADIAAYFASQKVVGDKVPANPVGHRLFTEGDAARGIPACVSCHGDNGHGQRAGDTVFPRIAGQHQRYLAKQLAEWKRDERMNSVGHVMNEIARKLTDSDIDHLSAHLAGMP